MSRPVAAELLREWLEAGPAWLALSGDSMRPTLSPGARLLVVDARGARLGTGDLVVFEAAGRLVCHRAVRVRRRSGAVLAKGDHPRTRPAWVRRSRVVARVVAVERGGARRAVDTAAGRALGRAVALVSLLGNATRPALRAGRALARRALGAARP
jgi:hypothetical protein